MYPEYKKVKDICDKTSVILNSTKEMKDIFEIATSMNQGRPAVTFINEKGKVQTYKYSQSRKNAVAYASIISDMMIDEAKNRPLVLKVANGPHWGEMFWAILMSGFKPLLIDAKTNKEGTENLIAQAKAVAILTDDSNNYSVRKISLMDVLTEKADRVFEPTWENEVIFCSSGTTGDVKMMVFNGENFAHQIAAATDFAETSKTLLYPKSMGPLRVLAMIPFHHIFGFVATYLWYLYFGANFVFPRTVAPSEIQWVCQKCQVTHVFSVPLFWDSLAQGLERKKALEEENIQKRIDNLIAYNLGKLPKGEAGPVGIVQNVIQKKLLGTKIKFCISGGGYLNKHTQEIINGIGYPLYNGYGMTEIGITSVELSPNVEDRLKGSIGIPLHGIEYTIKQNDKNVKSGELLIKSPITHIREIIAGVEKNVSLDKNGYFASGDIAEKDEDGRYYLRGRIKDIIINANGENIFPDELEIFFKRVEHVQAVCVLGVDKANSTDQRIVCVVEVDNNINDEELEALKKEMKRVGQEDLTKGTKITEFYFARKKLPIANNMKVKRFLVKKAIEDNSPDYIPFDQKKEAKKFKNFDKETIDSILIPMRQIFSKILILPEFKIEDDGHWINDLGGDSMSYVELISTVQDRFEVFIPEELYGQLATVNDFVEEVAKLQKERK